MGTILISRIRSRSRSRWTSRRNVVVAAGCGVATTVAATVVLILAGGAPAPVPRDPPSTVAAASAEVTPPEQAVVSAALRSGDPRLERIAEEVAAGRAGVSALADTRVLRHHRVVTSTMSPERLRSRAAIDRFHHRLGAG
jgi:hypothetical protein